MGNGKNTETDVKTETQKNNLTLAEKLALLKEELEQLKTTREKTRTHNSQANPYQPFSQESCVICGLPRLNGDPTGLTCGLPKCLSELGVRFEEKLGEESIIEELTEKLTEIANQLGLNQKMLPKELDGLLEAIAEEISTIKSTVEELT